MTTKPRIIIAGAGGSGKDYLRKQFEAKGFNIHVGYTSRPPRSNEKNGIDYRFISKELFEGMIQEDAFHEHMTFRDNYYGTTHKAMQECDVFIMTPPIIDVAEVKYRLYISRFVKK